MADYIYTMEIRLTPDQQKGVALVQDVALAAGMNVYLTGGAIRDIISGLVKSVMFGMTITAVGCHEGLATGAGPEQVGRSTTRAVVMSIFLVVVVDLIFTAIFFFVSGT